MANKDYFGINELEQPSSKVELNELYPGFYSMGGLPMSDGGNLVVAVHPYYGSDGYVDEENLYLKRLNNFVKFCKCPLITLEESVMCQKTFEHYLKMGLRENRFFIKTELDNPHPDEISYDEMFNYFDILRDDKPIYLVGGYYWGVQEYSGGCLGHLAAKLEDKGIPINILEDLVFG